MAIKKFMVDLSRSLRKNQTPEEARLWRYLRKRKLKNLKFLRQHPIVVGGSEFRPEFFIADFYCAEKRLVIELDGEIHDFQKEYDQDRDSIMRELGLRVLRIRNSEIEDLDSVLRKILAVVGEY
jgi:very-short-patch-repair endonuclease